MFERNDAHDELEGARKAAVDLESLAQIYILHDDLDRAAEVLHVAEQITRRAETSANSRHVNIRRA